RHDLFNRYLILTVSTPLPIPFFFCVHATATTEIYTLSLHDALPIYDLKISGNGALAAWTAAEGTAISLLDVQSGRIREIRAVQRSEEHTSELQSRFDLVCRLLLEKKK